MIGVDIVVKIVAHACILLCSAVLYVFLVACVLPRCMLKPRYDLSVIHDRGIKKYVFKNGRAIVYAPSIQASKYVRQYILSCHNREKYIKCKLDERIHSIKYDVIAFHANDTVIDVIQVAEPIYQDGVSLGALLPSDTSYVSIVVKEVNGMLVTSHTTLGISRSKVAIYMAVTILCSVIEGLAWNLTIMKWFGMALSNYDAPSMEHQLGMLLFYIAAGLAVSFAIVLFHSSKEVKIKK